MKTSKLFLMAVLAIAMASGSVYAQTGRGMGPGDGTGDPANCENFVDADGDGINDNAPGLGLRGEGRKQNGLRGNSEENSRFGDGAGEMLRERKQLRDESCESPLEGSGTQKRSGRGGGING